MKIRDPKFGFNWLWIAPLALIVIFYYDAKCFVLKHRPRLYNSRQQRLRKLAGIDKHGK